LSRAIFGDRVLTATNHELAEQSRLRPTEDFKEGVKATAERMVANFKGRSRTMFWRRFYSVLVSIPKHSVLF
jgi:hypothetical protein